MRLATGVSFPILLLALVVVLWDPVSPLAMDRANRAYLLGDHGQALRIYSEVVDGWHPRTTRKTAAERAALLALEAGEPVEAVNRMRESISSATGDERTRLQVRLAAIYAEQFLDQRRAAELLQEASDGGRRVDLAVAAARGYERAEAWPEAAAAWTSALPGLTERDARAEAEAGLLRAGRHDDTTTKESE